MVVDSVGLLDVTFGGYSIPHFLVILTIRKITNETIENVMTVPTK
jgi:hypothetical protein